MEIASQVSSTSFPSPRSSTGGSANLICCELSGCCEAAPGCRSRCGATLFPSGGVELAAPEILVACWHPSVTASASIAGSNAHTRINLAILFEPKSKGSLPQYIELHRRTAAVSRRVSLPATDGRGAPTFCHVWGAANRQSVTWGLDLRDHFALMEPRIAVRWHVRLVAGPNMPPMPRIPSAAP